MTGSTTQEELDLSALVRIVRRRRWMLAVVSIAGAALGFIFAAMMKETFQANAIITFDSTRANNNELSTSAKEVADSAKIINTVASTLNINLEPFSDRVVSRSVDNQLILRTIAETRELAGQMAKTWAETVVRHQTEQSDAIVQTQRAILSKLVDSAHKDVQDCQNKIAAFVIGNDAFERLEDNPVFNAYRSLQLDRSERVAELNQLTADLDLYTRPNAPLDELLNTPRARHDDILENYRKQKMMLEVGPSGKEDAESNHNFETRQNALQEAILAQVHRYPSQIKLDISRVKAIIEQYDQTAKQMRTEMTKAKTDNEAYAGLKQDLGFAQKRFSAVLEKLSEFDGNSGAIICKVVEDGAQNTSPYQRKQYAKYTILGLALGLLLGSMFGILLELELEPA